MGWSLGSTGAIKGSDTDYSSLPQPASTYAGQLWFVQNGSEGKLSSIGVYTKPSGLYLPNESNVWEITPLNVKVAEDSTTVINVVDWAEYLVYVVDIGIGHRVIYNNIEYVNLTGSQTATTPNLDTTNWKYPEQYATFVQMDIVTDSTYSAGKIHYNQTTKGHVADTGYTDVRLDMGREAHIEVYNITASTINNGDPVSVTGTLTGVIPNVVPTDSSSVVNIIAFAGVATMTIPAGQSGLVTKFGRINDVNTQSLSVGFMYADGAGWFTQIRPLYPAQRLLVGGVLQTGTTDGIMSVGAQIIPRQSASRSYSFTSSAIGAGLYYKGGFYDWATTSIALTQVSLTQVYGTVGRTYAAHAGIVPSAAGIVDTGQVGLRVTGIIDSETGVQIAAQTGIVTEDITTLTANVMAETSEKFSGQITYELYVVSGTPVNYSLSFNYGYSKYEDLNNRNATITGLECVWQGNALDTVFDIALKHHRPTDWTYAATGFLPGNGDIARKTVDQSLAGDVNNNKSGAWKRTDLNFFVEGNGSEGVLFEIITGANNTIQTMDLHVIAVSEEL